MTGRKKVALPVLVRERAAGRPVVVLILVEVKAYAQEDAIAVHAFKRGSIDLRYLEIDGKLWMPTNGSRGLVRRRFAHLIAHAGPRDVKQQADRLLSLGVAQHPRIHCNADGYLPDVKVVDRRDLEDGWAQLARRRAPEIQDRFCLVGDRIWCRSHGPLLVLRDGPNGVGTRWAGGSTIHCEPDEAVLPLADWPRTFAWLQQEWPGVAAALPRRMPEWHWTGDEQTSNAIAEQYVWNRLRRLQLENGWERDHVQCLIEGRRVMGRRWDDAGIPYPWEEGRALHIHGRVLPPAEELEDLIRMLADLEGESGTMEMAAEWLLAGAAARRAARSDEEALARIGMP